MNIKILENLATDSKPVNESPINQKLVLSKDFIGMPSSLTGFCCKRMYLGKIDQITGNCSNSELRVLCGDECKDKCVILHK